MSSRKNDEQKFKGNLLWMWMQHSTETPLVKDNRNSVILAGGLLYRRECRGPSPWISVRARQLRRNIAVMASRWRRCV